MGRRAVRRRTYIVRRVELSTDLLRASQCQLSKHQATKEQPRKSLGFKRTSSTGTQYILRSTEYFWKSRSWMFTKRSSSDTFDIAHKSTWADAAGISHEQRSMFKGLQQISSSAAKTDDLIGWWLIPYTSARVHMALPLAKCEAPTLLAPVEGRQVRCEVVMD